MPKPVLAPRVMNKQCKICGRSQLYHEGKEPHRCPRCGREYGTEKFFPSHNPDATPTKHNQVRWGCRECGHYGVTWVLKSSSLMKCPACEVQNYGHLHIEKVDPSGDCDTIWQPVEGIKRPLIKTKLPKKKKYCDHCGHTQRYLVRYSPRCPRCDYGW